ncbi:MAG: hypothetical protein PF795_12365 [Kiritimatiellae bacterium]|jgi:hypothetical protein|nr:hypothetical protein [Kiritimatiellia bacterium]
MKHPLLSIIWISGSLASSHIRGGLNTIHEPYWWKISEDKSRILVVTEPRNTMDDFTILLPDGRSVNYRDTFSGSGVYDLQTLEVVWSLNYYDFTQSDAVWSEDFSLMVIWQLQFPGVKQGLNFIKNGKLIKNYPEEVLYTAFSEWYNFSGWDSFISFDLDGHLLTFTTPRRVSPSPWGSRDIGYWEIYTFDVSTGEMLSREIENTKTKKIITMVTGGFVLIICLIIGLFVWWVKHDKPKGR